LTPTTLALTLATALPQERVALLTQNRDSFTVALADALRVLYLERAGSDTTTAIGAVESLRTVADLSRNSEIGAYAAWVEGLAALQLERQLERTIERVDSAAATFAALGQAALVPQTQVSKVVALAILGRYDEAIACGEKVKQQFETVGDDQGAGKIELNLGNLYHRRGELAQAEQLYRSAQSRFLTLADDRHTAMAENGLANVLTLNHQFRAALALYEHAQQCAANAGMDSTQAAIETNIGILALAQGRYDLALDALERSRRRFAQLGMAQNALAAQSELADAYLELNLIPEAVEIYQEVIPQYRESGMKAELAHALLQNTRAALAGNALASAHTLLAEAQSLYEEEGNQVGIANVALLGAQGQLLKTNGSYEPVLHAARLAATIFEERRIWGRWLLARWLYGEALRLQGDTEQAFAVLHATLEEATRRSAPQIAQRCHTSLGLLAKATHAPTAADHFQAALTLTESLRAPLPADTFRTAFVADKMTPYTELVRLYLDGGQIDLAFEVAERARARALRDLLGAPEGVETPRDDFEQELLVQRATLREELNWYYSQLNRAKPTISSADDIGAAIQQRESGIQAIERQLHQVTPTTNRPFTAGTPDVAALQAQVANHTAVVAYYLLDEEWLAFVVTSRHVTVVRNLSDNTTIDTALQRLRFQLETMRYGQASLKSYSDLLLKRARYYLSSLYDQLLRPLEADMESAEKIIVIPHGVLHYLPFHALHDGIEYALERWELSYAPSAAVLGYCLARPAPTWQSALLVGVPDEYAPRVRDEVETLAPLFPKHLTLLEGEATFAALREHAPTADILHLACHGQFRPDNPLFSAVRLGDGWVNVYDTYRLRLNGGLVTLSACETGVNAVAPGDELLGLARGLFSAGALSLVVSLWTVDDAATADLMATFYRELLAGSSPATALRHAQFEVMAVHPHPFYWSPFVLMGRA
jgi:CHAT domain-containing protein/tetratricopeptide (TPR) repeat protein